MLLPVGIEPRSSNFNAFHATVWAYSLLTVSLRTCWENSVNHLNLILQKFLMICLGPFDECSVM